jgi:hypothetical protein
MKVSELKAALKPFTIITGAPGLVPEYSRAIMFENTMAVKTGQTTMWGKAPAEFEEPVEVEVRDFNGVISSLPDGEEFHIEVDENKLRWECGQAHGGLAFRPGRDDIPKPPRLPKKMTAADAKLARMFLIGSASCSNVALQSIGLHGAAIYPSEDYTWCMSSDDVSIAACKMDGPPIVGLKDTIFVGPKEAQLLASLCERKGSICLADNAFLYFDKGLTAIVNLCTPLKHDLRKMLDRYIKTEEIIIPLAHEQIKSFIKRAIVLSDLKTRVVMSILVSKGRLALIFAEEKAYSEEFYLAEGIPEDINYEINLHVNRFSSSSNYSHAFGASDELIADMMKSKVLVIRSKAKDFYYAIGGHAT